MRYDFGKSIWLESTTSPQCEKGVGPRADSSIGVNTSVGKMFIVLITKTKLNRFQEKQLLVGKSIVYEY